MSRPMSLHRQTVIRKATLVPPRMTNPPTVVSVVAALPPILQDTAGGRAGEGPAAVLRRLLHLSGVASRPGVPVVRRARVASDLLCVARALGRRLLLFLFAVGRSRGATRVRDMPAVIARASGAQEAAVRRKVVKRGRVIVPRVVRPGVLPMVGGSGVRVWSPMPGATPGSLSSLSLERSQLPLPLGAPLRSSTGRPVLIPTS